MVSDTPHYENRQVGEANEVPFEVPESWEWTNLGDITNYGNCENVDVNDIPKEGWVLELEDLEKDSAKIIQQLTKDERDIKGVRHSFHKGDVLYSKLRTYLNKVMVANEDGFCTTEIIPITCMSYVLPEYLNHVLRSKYFVDYTIQCGYGVKMPRLSTTDACNGQIPLPPYNEQKYIVASIEGWFQLIDILESDQVDLDEAIQKAKSKILDLAIHGKLVPQDPNDEPAIELLKRINPKFTPCDNAQYPYDVPNNWKWVTMEDVTVNRDSERIPLSLAVRKQQQNKVYNYYGAAGVIDKVENYLFDERLLLIGEDGANLLSRNKDNAFFAEGKYWVNNHAHVLDCPNKSVLDYVALVINSMSLENYITGSAQPKLTQENLNKILIPLPPLSEQKRIVTKIEELFAVLDEIQKSIEA